MTPKAFISYSHDGREHRDWVLALATRLRQDGVEMILDRWALVPGDQIPAFMERAIRENDFVLIVCTPRYKDRSDNRTGGVGYEGDIMTAEALTRGNPRKFIPILRSGEWDVAAPSWFRGKLYVDLRGDPYGEEQYQELLTTLMDTRAQPPAVSARTAPMKNVWDTWGTARRRAVAAVLNSQTERQAMGKEQILSKTGFVENHIRQLWFSHSARKIFSHDVIRDHDTGWLESKLQEQVPDGQFWFYFNTAPSTLEECERILCEMRLSGLTAVVKASFSR